MDRISLSGIVFILGAYGSGKSEIAVQVAALHARKGMAVQLIDMDLVNPYFRTREARNALSDVGVDVILPEKEYINADLPIVSPKVLGALRHPKELTLVDVGGDPVGAMPVASFKEALFEHTPDALMVINPYRPFTSTTKGVLQMRSALEASSGIPITGLIANPNLLDDTTPEIIREGAEKIQTMADELHLPCRFIALSETFQTEFSDASFDCPVLWLRRHLVPPWLRPGKLDEDR